MQPEQPMLSGDWNDSKGAETLPQDSGTGNCRSGAGRTAYEGAALAGERGQEQPSLYLEAGVGTAVKIATAARGQVCLSGGVRNMPSWRMQGREHLKK